MANTEAVTFFTGSDLFGWINIQEPAEMITEADLTVDDLVAIDRQAEIDMQDDLANLREEMAHRRELGLAA